MFGSHLKLRSCSVSLRDFVLRLSLAKPRVSVFEGVSGLLAKNKVLE